MNDCLRNWKYGLPVVVIVSLITCEYLKLFEGDLACLPPFNIKVAVIISVSLIALTLWKGYFIKQIKRVQDIQNRVCALWAMMDEGIASPFFRDMKFEVFRKVRVKPDLPIVSTYRRIR